MASDPALVLPLALHWRKGSATTRCLTPGWTAISGYWRQRGGIEQRRESNLRNHSKDDQCSVLAQCPSLAQPYARWYFPSSRVSALPTQRGDRYLSAEVRQGERLPMRRLLHWRKKESTFLRRPRCWRRQLIVADLPPAYISGHRPAAAASRKTAHALFPLSCVNRSQSPGARDGKEGAHPLAFPAGPSRWASQTPALAIVKPANAVAVKDSPSTSHPMSAVTPGIK